MATEKFLTNPSLVVTADHNLFMEDAPILEPDAGEVLVQVKATGICGSDIHFWRHGAIGDLKVEGNCILGHEGAGVIKVVGRDVVGLKTGDRVAIEPGVSCGTCFLCADGRPNLCEEVAFSGVYPHAGTIQRYKVHPARYVHKVSEKINFGIAALVEPLSVAMHALRTTPIQIGTPVAVFGAGPIGLVTMAVARASGAHPIVISDLDEGRLRFAKSFLPECVSYKVDLAASSQQNGRNIRALFAQDDKASEYDMPQLVLECTGVESSIATAAFTVRRGGRINVVGVSSKPNINNIPFMHLSLAEIELRFINRYHDTWPAAIRALEGGLIDLKKLQTMITHTFALEDSVQAMELVSGGGQAKNVGDFTCKVQIVDE